MTRDVGQWQRGYLESPHLIKNQNHNNSITDDNAWYFWTHSAAPASGMTSRYM